jgi:glycosyltransferase involved in cell wall biosynthesis
VLVREEAVFVQDIWLEELVRSCQQQDIGAASPLIHQAGDAKILNSGNVLGLLSDIASPYSGKVEVGDAGYLDCLLVTRDVSTLPSSCLIIHKDTYLATGGMDEDELGDHYAEVDLCLKIRKAGKRLVVHPRSSVVYGGDTTPYDLQHRLDQMQAKREASRSFRQRWGKSAINDRYWNPNLSLSNAIPQPEAEFRAQWQYLPSKKPRILAHPLGNGQGDYRIVDPLSAVRKAGLAQECIWRQYTVGMAKYFTSAEISRLEPTTVIAQNYIHDLSLMVLDEWSAMGCRPFIVYALDDLINDLDKTNPFRQFIPPNARSRLKYALARCDRLVVSTNFLAETYQHFIPDIRVVPNRLQKDIWCVHKNLKRTSNKPRIGWAGGTTHQGDLLLLKEIIEQTRHEADWIFFGMCPVEIRPLLAEYHELVPFNEYPAYLASLNLDIAVAPLAISPFNQGKSNLRLLEYGALGIPVVCTNIDPYHNSPACRVENSPEAWIAALRERIYDAEGREREGLAMRNWVLNSYVLEDHLDDWLSAHLPG